MAVAVKIFKYFSFFVAFMAGLWVLALVFQRYIILQPKGLEKSHKFTFEQNFAEGHLEVSDGVQLNYLYFKSKKPTGTMVIYLHGNADNLERWGRYASDFTSKGADVLMYDYRSYGKSGGYFTQENALADALKMYDYIIKTHKPQRVIIYGRSLGSGIATYLSTQRASSALVLETPYYSIADVWNSRIGIVDVEPFIKINFPSYVWIKNTKAPVYIFHGTYDRVVPYKSGLKLSQCIDSKLITIEKGDHKNLFESPVYHEHLKRILGLSNQNEYFYNW